MSGNVAVAAATVMLKATLLDFITGLEQTTGKNIPAPAGFSIFDASYIQRSEIRYILLPYNFKNFFHIPFFILSHLKNILQFQIFVLSNSRPVAQERRLSNQIITLFVFADLIILILRIWKRKSERKRFCISVLHFS